MSKKLRLVLTCVACPEQYDVYFGEEKVGYLRLRHGIFQAEHKGQVVHSSNTRGDGRFEDGERNRHLNAACAAILNCIMTEDAQPELFKFGEPRLG